MTTDQTKTEKRKPGRPRKRTVAEQNQATHDARNSATAKRKPVPVTVTKRPLGQHSTPKPEVKSQKVIFLEKLVANREKQIEELQGDLDAMTDLYKAKKTLVNRYHNFYIAVTATRIGRWQAARAEIEADLTTGWRR